MMIVIVIACCCFYMSMRPKTRKEIVEGISLDVEYGNVYPDRPEVERAVASYKADDSQGGYQRTNLYDDQNIPLNFKGEQNNRIVAVSHGVESELSLVGEQDNRIVAVSQGAVSEMSLFGGRMQQPEKNQKTGTIFIV